MAKKEITVALAGNPNTPPHILEAISKYTQNKPYETTYGDPMRYSDRPDNSTKKRSWPALVAISGNKNTPIRVLKKLVDHPDKNISDKAKAQIAEGRPSTVSLEKNIVGFKSIVK